MGTSEIMSAVAALAVSVAAAATVAGLKDEGRERLLNWVRHTGRWLYRLFLVVGIGNSVVGAAAFGLATTQPSRGDILLLVLHLFNFFAIGTFALLDVATRHRTRRVMQPGSQPQQGTIDIDDDNKIKNSLKLENRKA